MATSDSAKLKFESARQAHPLALRKRGAMKLIYQHLQSLEGISKLRR